MKVCMLTPPPLDGKKVADRIAGCAYGLYPIPNIFILNIATILKEKGHQISCEEFPTSNRNEEDFERFLANDNSDVYCFYTVNLTKQTDLEALRRIRKSRGEVPVIFCGPAPTYTHRDFIVDPNVFVVRGEPELTITELVGNIEKRDQYPKIKGMSYLEKEIRDNDFRELIKNIDSLPFPDRNLLGSDAHKYCNPKLGIRPFTAVLASRNCTYKCKYCVPGSLSFATEMEYRRYHNNKKPPVRLRTAKNVIEEFELLKRQGYKSVMFLDDMFIWGGKRTIEICEGIKDLGIYWGCATRADTITEDKVKAMARANCLFIDLGIESFDQRILDYVSKDLDVKKIEPAVGLIKKYGIKAKANILIGCSPLETKDTIRYTQKMIKKLDFDQVMYNIYNPFPGTELYKVAKEDGWFIKGDYYPSDVQKEVIIKLPHLTPRDLKWAVKKGNLEFFLDPVFILKNITKFNSVGDFWDAFKALKRKLI